MCLPCRFCGIIWDRPGNHFDENGAEKLLGRGDMLFKPIDENHPIRLPLSQMTMRSGIINFVKEQAEADYDDDFDPGEVSESDLTEGMGGSDEAILSLKRPRRSWLKLKKPVLR